MSSMFDGSQGSIDSSG